MKQSTGRTVRLDKEGAYLFRAPQRVSTSLTHELLLVFVAEGGSCGFLRFDPRGGVKRFDSMAETLFVKITLGLGRGMGPLRVKLFGGSGVAHATLAHIRSWLEAKGLRVAAQDTGRSVSRSIVVDCATGQVG